MSGRTKRVIYHILSAVALLAAAAGTILLACLGHSATFAIGILLCFLLCLMLLPLHTVLHELGHVLGGLICGMRVLAVSFGIYNMDRRGKFTVKLQPRRDANGATALLPKGERGVRGKLIFALLCGAVLNFIYAAVMFALYFAVTQHPAMLFFTLFAPFSVYEGLTALYPVELPAGPTDGQFALGLVRRTPEAEVALRVMTAQGLLYTNDYEELPPDLLFGAPVVREDDVAFLALLQLQWRYLYRSGKDFSVPLARLGSLIEDCSGEERAEIAADLVFAQAIAQGGAAGAEEYRAELEGGSPAVLCAMALLDPTPANLSQAERAVKAERMKGVKDFESDLIARFGK